MKAVAFALTLMLCLIGIVDSKLIHELSSRDHQGEPEFSEFDDVALSDFGRDNDEYKKRNYYDSDDFKCRKNMESCEILVRSKYNTRDNWAPIAIPLRIRLAGARAVCRDGMKFGQCVKSEVDQPVCQRGLHEYFRSMIEKHLSLGQKLCVDRIDDFAKHWHCILSLKVYTKLTKCAPRYGPGPGPNKIPCNINEIIDCVVNAYGSTPGCEAGATDFIREFLPEVLNLNGPVCPSPVTGGPGFARSLQEILKIK